MTKKKLNNLIKFIVCIAPFVMVVIALLGFNKAYEQTGNFSVGTYGNIVYNFFALWFKPISIFNDFNDWLTNTFGISGNNTMIGWFTIYYIEYLMFVEFIWLFKNIICYIFSMANKIIERGFGNDKE